MLHFTPLVKGFNENMAGDLRFFANENSDTPLNKQINKAYSFGGGWNPLNGFEFNQETKGIKYPGDPELLPLAVATFKEQQVYLYHYSWVAIVNPDKSFEVSRVD